jgi:hypothetical protein
MVLLPMGADQMLNAERARQLRFAEVLDPVRATPEAIELATEGHDDAPGQLAQSSERTLEQIARLLIEDRPQRQVRQRAVAGARSAPGDRR